MVEGVEVVVVVVKVMVVVMVVVESGVSWEVHG